MATAVTRSTRTEARPAPAGCARVRVSAGGRVAELSGSAPWAPRPLHAEGATARVALVQTSAMLLGGDRVALDVELEAGAALEIVETGASVAYSARGGPPTSIEVTVRLGADARLLWLARPLVLAEGCSVRRAVSVELAESARALLRDTVVLGRSGEQPGRLRATTHVTHAGRPLLVEQLRTDDLALLRSGVVAGSGSVIDALYLLGARGATDPGAVELAGPGSVWRCVAAEAASAEAAATRVAEVWRGAMG